MARPSRYIRVALDAASYAVGPGGLSIAAPQLLFPVAYLAVYGVGIASVGPGNLQQPAMVTVAVVLGGLGVVLGSILGWARFGRAHLYPPRRAARAVIHSEKVAFVGAVLVAIGLASLVLYLARLETLPILMDDIERGRVETALRAGAPLRVLGLLALPGMWLLVGHAAASSSWRGAASVSLLLLVAAALWLSTANRAPSFLLVEVAALTALYARGRERVGLRGLGVIAVAGILAIGAAGLVGAIRLASMGNTTGDRASLGVDPSRLIALTTIAIQGYARVPVQNLEYVMEAVPNLIPWRLGYTYLQPLLTALPGRQTTFDLDLKAALGQTFAGGGTVPGLLGESYANFGPFGWLFVPAVVAFALQWAFAMARRLGTSVAWTLYAYVITLAINGLVGGLIVASPFPFIAIGVLGAACAWSATWGKLPRRPWSEAG